MALLHRERHVVDRPTFEWPDWWRRWMDLPANGERLRTEEYHEGDTLVIRVEMPGMDPDKDVEVSVARGAVTIRAHREQQDERKNGRGYRSEFRYGEFVRELPLPEGTSTDDVKASYADGILEVRVPCPESAEPPSTRVPVNRA